MHNMHLDVIMRVDKPVLLEAIKVQREEHAKSYKEAQDGWRTSMMTIAKQILEKGSRLKKFPMAVRRLNSPPECHLQDFDDAIKMIEMSVDAVVELSSDDYAQLILGRWDWQREWATSNKRYMSGPTGATGSSGATGSTGITEDELE